jgi:hypothetical protein
VWAHSTKNTTLLSFSDVRQSVFASTSNFYVNFKNEGQQKDPPATAGKPKNRGRGTLRVGSLEKLI